MKYLLLFLIVPISLSGFSQTANAKNTSMDKRTLTCKLTSPELQKRKTTIIANLKKQIIEKKELSNGYSYKFKGIDKVIDELVTFIKTERLCCDFFDFEIKVNGNASFAWLTITGPKGTKDFIKSELEL